MNRFFLLVIAIFEVLSLSTAFGTYLQGRRSDLHFCRTNDQLTQICFPFTLPTQLLLHTLPWFPERLSSLKIHLHHLLSEGFLSTKMENPTFGLSNQKWKFRQRAAKRRPHLPWSLEEALQFSLLLPESSWLTFPILTNSKCWDLPVYIKIMIDIKLYIHDTSTLDEQTSMQFWICIVCFWQKIIWLESGDKGWEVCRRNGKRLTEPSKMYRTVSWNYKKYSLDYPILFQNFKYLSTNIAI